MKLDNETTAFNPDHREQLDLSTPHPIPGPDAPLYHNLLAPNQWPSTTHLPSFRPVYEDYMRRMSRISTLFTSLIAEAIGLPPDAFNKFFDEDQQHKLKIVKYPEVDVPDLPAGASEIDRKKWEIKRQGVGPHKDSMLTSYLLQASDQPGLQAQNARGEWVDCKPIAGTLVVAIGQGMEALTDGVCASTTHRVLSPRRKEGARYSVPFFQGVSYDAKFEAMDVPEGVLKLRDEARKARRDDVEFTFVKGRWGHLGEATLMNRVKSHPDVGERWVCRLTFWKPLCLTSAAWTHVPNTVTFLLFLQRLTFPAVPRSPSADPCAASCSGRSIMTKAPCSASRNIEVAVPLRCIMV